MSHAKDREIEGQRNGKDNNITQNTMLIK